MRADSVRIRASEFLASAMPLPAQYVQQNGMAGYGTEAAVKLPPEEEIVKAFEEVLVS